MSYVLDGIVTAMEHEAPAEGVIGEIVQCPCGRSVAATFRGERLDRAALRFHYTWCPKARTPTPSEATTT